MKKIIAIILLVLVLGVLLAGFLHTRTHLQIVKRYLEQNRPDVVAAIEAYRSENGSYPDFITNAVPRYYKGRQERLYFLESYGYRNLGTNYYLKHFSSKSLRATPDSRSSSASRLTSFGPACLRSGGSHEVLRA